MMEIDPVELREYLDYRDYKLQVHMRAALLDVYLMIKRKHAHRAEGGEHEKETSKESGQAGRRSSSESKNDEDSSKT